jgi:hypothetical protein
MLDETIRYNWIVKGGTNSTKSRTFVKLFYFSHFKNLGMKTDRLFALSVQIILIRVLICGHLPKPLSKGLLRLGCSEDQICGLEQMALSHSQKVRGEMMMSFLTGKKERKRARKLLHDHCPYMFTHKCKIEDSYCLQLRVEVPAESSDAQAKDMGCAQRTRDNEIAQAGGKKTPSALEVRLCCFYMPVVLLRPLVRRFGTGSI